MLRGLYRQVLLDFQEFIEDETKNKKHQHFKIGNPSSAILTKSKTFINKSETFLFQGFEPIDHGKITDLIQQACTQVLFLYFRHLKSLKKNKYNLNLMKKRVTILIYMIFSHQSTRQCFVSSRL